MYIPLISKPVVTVARKKNLPERTRGQNLKKNKTQKGDHPLDIAITKKLHCQKKKSGTLLRST